MWWAKYLSQFLSSSPRTITSDILPAPLGGLHWKLVNRTISNLRTTYIGARNKCFRFPTCVASFRNKRDWNATWDENWRQIRIFLLSVVEIREEFGEVSESIFPVQPKRKPIYVWSFLTGRLSVDKERGSKKLKFDSKIEPLQRTSGSSTDYIRNDSFCVLYSTLITIPCLSLHVLYEPVNQTIGVVNDRRAVMTELVNVDFVVFTNSADPSVRRCLRVFERRLSA